MRNARVREVQPRTRLNLAQNKIRKEPDRLSSYFQKISRLLNICHEDLAESLPVG